MKITLVLSISLDYDKSEDRNFADKLLNCDDSEDFWAITENNFADYADSIEYVTSWVQ
jgi:hypothetical protein